MSGNLYHQMWTKIDAHDITAGLLSVECRNRCTHIAENFVDCICSYEWFTLQDIKTL